MTAVLQLPEGSVRPPAVGSTVQVRWTDGNLYGAVFKGVNRTTTVKVLQSSFLHLLLLGKLTVIWHYVNFARGK